MISILFYQYLTLIFTRQAMNGSVAIHRVENRDVVLCGIYFACFKSDTYNLTIIGGDR